MRKLNAYLSFQNNAREAMSFYQSVLGGDLSLSTFSDFPSMPHDPGDDDLIMHANLVTDDGLALMGSDTPHGMPVQEPSGFSLSLSGDDETALMACWDALSDGGTVTMPLDTPPWGGKFGMLTDRFGVGWMVSIDAA
ncbi:VOC family protein [Microbacterium kribbense]|uniref:VOC family protein n=1 Tax=Microbacterium kribbense TaxID=433645 RepID=A0ABP7GNA7_9MICO